MNFSLKVEPRINDIVVQNLENEVLIYDLKSNQAFRLNETMAKVWNFLDGQKTAIEIADLTDISLELVLFSIDELQTQNLVRNTVETGLAKDRVSRRKMMMKFASAAVAFPIIYGIVAPTAVQAQSDNCIQPGGPPGSIIISGPSGTCLTVNCNTVCNSIVNASCCSNAATWNGTCTNIVIPGIGPFAQCRCICT